MVEYKLPVIMTNPDGSKRGKGGLEPDEACELAVLLEKAGVDMIQVAQANHTGNMGDTIPPMGTMPYNWTLPVAERVKALVGVPVATVGRVITPEAGEKILEEGKADVIGYGRSLLADPDIALKVASGEPVRLCLNCNKGCVDAIQGRRYISCVLNAENGDEETIFIKPGEGEKRVAVRVACRCVDGCHLAGSYGEVGRDGLDHRRVVALVKAVRAPLGACGKLLLEGAQEGVGVALRSLEVAARINAGRFAVPEHRAQERLKTRVVSTAQACVQQRDEGHAVSLGPMPGRPQSSRACSPNWKRSGSSS